MKKNFHLAALIFLFSGCQSQNPDFITMLSPVQLNETMQKEDIFLVDVHTPQQAHIKGTDLFIPYDEIDKHLDKLPVDKNTPIYLYCEGGPMGSAAAKTLYRMGYRNLYNLEGGANAWRESKFELE